MGKLWPLLLILIGAVWLIEKYLVTDIPFVPILLIVIGLYYFLRKEKKK